MIAPSTIVAPKCSRRWLILRVSISSMSFATAMRAYAIYNGSYVAHRLMSLNSSEYYEKLACSTQFATATTSTTVLRMNRPAEYWRTCWDPQACGALSPPARASTAHANHNAIEPG